MRRWALAPHGGGPVNVASPPWHAPSQPAAEPPLTQLVARAGLVNKVTTRLVMPLLVIAVIVGALFGADYDEHWLLGLAVVVTAAAIGTGWGLRRSGRPERWLFVRSVVMTGFIMAAITLTGELRSAAWALFPLNVIAAALLLPRTPSWVAFGFIAAGSATLIGIEARMPGRHGRPELPAGDRP